MHEGIEQQGSLRSCFIADHTSHFAMHGVEALAWFAKGQAMTGPAPQQAGEKRHELIRIACANQLFDARDTTDGDLPGQRHVSSS
ncbi:hypothetical protein [Sphingomonas sp.]